MRRWKCWHVMSGMHNVEFRHRLRFDAPWGHGRIRMLSQPCRRFYNRILSNPRAIRVLSRRSSSRSDLWRPGANAYSMGCGDCGHAVDINKGVLLYKTSSTSNVEMYRCSREKGRRRKGGGGGCGVVGVEGERKSRGTARRPRARRCFFFCYKQSI